MTKVHHGGKVGQAASLLAKHSTSKRIKRDSAKTLANHKHRMH